MKLDRNELNEDNIIGMTSEILRYAREFTCSVPLFLVLFPNTAYICFLYTNTVSIELDNFHTQIRVV
jgi:hypothetical protein